MNFKDYIESVVRKPRNGISLGIEDIEDIYLVKLKVGDGYKYEIRDYGLKPPVILGWLAGFENGYGNITGYGKKDEMFHLYNTGMMAKSASEGWLPGKVDERANDPKYLGKGIYRAAVQAVANLYPKGLYLRKGEASNSLQNSLKKMSTYQEFGESGYWDKILVIKPI
jgi:hypothetical protein